MKQRIITAIIAIAIFVPVVYLGGIPFATVIYLAGTVGLYELLRMKKMSIVSVPGLLSFLLLWLLLAPHTWLIHAYKMEGIVVAVLLFLTYSVLTKNRFTFDEVGFALLSTVYVGMGFCYMLEIRSGGLVYLLFALFIIWATDSGAYFVGRAVGKKKLWPEISPNKTIEGAVGGVVCALVVAALFFFFAPLDQSLIYLLLIGLVISIFGQIGDLAQSAFKRHYGVKDSGKILPGHGGILDRFDSLLFILPILYFLMMA
ncbi:phosphatidate cytidylyltransferase [Priestia koreensis]|uniref:Phosphatidate cytidylyltransferase n=1 Tax=Priestia koreensis TaxID=284581 RepID=A0A0M0L6C3_9BACI|nr:phosphatidate cytidylyltransferase [Priestia koreensis]KOO46584.1 phosphatidate cytidylyltransferase [Priestia koreensis]